MQPISRRSLFSMAAASVAASVETLRARALQTVGVQLYTVRRVLPKQPLETLRAIEKIGYREVEVTWDTVEVIWSSLKQTSLKAVSAHLGTDLFIRQQDKLPVTLDDAAKRGFEYVVCPYIMPKDRGGADVMRKLGETLNKAGEICRKAGLKLCYHNHAFEYAPSGEGKGRLLDVLMQTADPKLVNLELDVMWAHVAGVDPVSVIKQYGDRILLMHLKNVAPEVAQRYDEMIPRTGFREVGNGVVDMPAVLAAAKKAGVKHYFVEQDETPGDPIESLRKSFDYLEGLS